MAEEPMPVVLLRDGVPGPIGPLCIDKNDPSLLILFVTVAPDIKIAQGRPARLSGLLKPGMLIGSMVEHEICDDTNPPPMRFMKKGSEVFERAVIREHVAIIGHIVAIIPQGRREKRQEPDAGDP